MPRRREERPPGRREKVVGLEKVALEKIVLKKIAGKKLVEGNIVEPLGASYFVHQWSYHTWEKTVNGGGRQYFVILRSRAYLPPVRSARSDH
jgi:hypothetical protein